MGLFFDVSYGDIYYILFIKISGIGCNEMFFNLKCLLFLCIDYDMDKV